MKKNNNGWIITNKNYRRKKTSVYLPQHIYNRLDALAQAKELSFSAAVCKMVEQSLEMR